ncbi:MAG: hypothetical protein MUD01_00440 [Chloroflexaceae bacterium]|nr:hypothetical protein [Chloroflexaceae bacterium]
MQETSPFQSFFMGGFECATHRRIDGTRLDLVIATRHDRHAQADYARLPDHGIRTARDGLRWHLIERRPGTYEFASLLPMLRAARQANVQVIWDLCHYGWPDDLTPFEPNFVRRFARFARAAAEVLAEESIIPPIVVPINEISFLSWVAGEVGHFSPYAHGRGHELKQRLVEAAIAAIEAVWEILPGTRIAHVDPLVRVLPASQHPNDVIAARRYHEAQYEAWDMLCGKRDAHLGGHPRYLDIIGANYYPHNQWILQDGNPSIGLDDPRYRPLRQLLTDLYQRYQRPMFISETSAFGGNAREHWLRYIGREVRAALKQGLSVQGICLYPIVDAPDWNTGLPLHAGLWQEPTSPNGERTLYQPLAEELRRQQQLFAQLSLPEAPAPLSANSKTR